MKLNKLTKADKSIVKHGNIIAFGNVIAGRADLSPTGQIMLDIAVQQMLKMQDIEIRKRLFSDEKIPVSSPPKN